jgi:flavin reductase (DIM6/NTAB) family NADH-FMN oxidoreductase RutF
MNYDWKNNSMAVEPQTYKDTLARWASGVTVVTTVKDHQWKGTTVSSFTSVSLEPPLVLICIANHLFTKQLLSETGVFAASILNHEQAELGKLFAGMLPQIEDRFAYGGNWRTAVTGCPVLMDSSGWVDCTIVNTIEIGDHTLFIGQVEAGGSKDIPPLVYHNRTWGTFIGT